MDLICDFPLRIGGVNSDEEKMDIRTEFDKYQLWARGLKSKSPASFEQFEKKKRTMLDYFLAEGGDKWPLLKAIGTRVFSLIASSACVERSNSTMGFIHSKLRNRLDTGKVVKLSYIRSNAHHVIKDINIEALRDIAEEEALTVEENALLEGEYNLVESNSGDES